MEKLWKFLKSMTFGVILLGLICAISVAGSLIPQNADPMTYVRAYPNHYGLIFSLQLDHVFTSWYFIAVTVLLCLNLTFCSIVRFRRIVSEEEEVAKAARVRSVEKTDPETLVEIRNRLRRLHCQEETKDGMTVFHKNSFGRYGTFLTHLGILLTVIFWALAMYLPKIIDRTCMPKDSLFLDDGTEIHVDEFSIADSSGRLDYKSVINIILPDGKESGLREVSVNHPVSMGRYKVYQQTYGTRGAILVRDGQGHEDMFYMDTNDFLSKDGENGLLYDNVYPDFKEENGEMSLVTSTSGSYENPVYVFTTIEDGRQKEVMLAFPHDKTEIGELEFEFLDPVEYPGLRIKESPKLVNTLLLISFLIMTAGLYITFFLQPVMVCVDGEGYTVLGVRPDSMRYELKQVVNRNKEKKNA
ncbi:MAG: cytochrome c biogenesis protein ResB [Solobacterium sp.]|nr:cytochrome c biogenesis protein ResB [Solobacterium sp.]